jgi:glycosyltransferase involved in cell wall biosynthesis
MISIITAIRNQLAMNRLYFQHLKKYTSHPFELIIIDNDSTDGSREFFEQNGAVIIRNEKNYAYSHCQNQGMELAKYDVLAFFNNDIIVSKNWDEHLIRIMQHSQFDFLSFATNDRIESQAATLRMQRKWKRIKYPVNYLSGYSESGLKMMLKLMYGIWERWTEKRRHQFSDQLMEGFSGSCIVCTKNGLDKIGKWDERILEADFDLYFRIKKRNLEFHDVQPLQIMLGIYFHHYGRLSARRKSLLPFADAKQIIPLEKKWKGEMDFLLKDIGH